MLLPSGLLPVSEDNGGARASPFLQDMRLFQHVTFAHGVLIGFVKTFLALPCYPQLFLPNPPPHPPFTAIRSATWSEGSLSYPFPLHFILHGQLSRKTSCTSHPIWHLLGGFEKTHWLWKNGKHCSSPPKEYLGHAVFKENISYLTFMQRRNRLKRAPKLPCECLLYLCCIMSFSASSHSLQPGLPSLWLPCPSNSERSEEHGREPDWSTIT